MFLGRTRESNNYKRIILLFGGKADEMVYKSASNTRICCNINIFMITITTYIGEIRPKTDGPDMSPSNSLPAT